MGRQKQEHRSGRKHQHHRDDSRWSSSRASNQNSKHSLAALDQRILDNIRFHNQNPADLQQSSSAIMKYESQPLINQVEDRQEASSIMKAFAKGGQYFSLKFPGRNAQSSSQQQSEIMVAKLEREIIHKNGTILRYQDSMQDLEERKAKLAFQNEKQSLDILQKNSYIKQLESEHEHTQSCHKELIKDAHRRIKSLEEALRIAEQEKKKEVDKMKATIRLQQEESFKRIDSAKWTPKDEGELKVELERLKESMKRTSKTLAINNANDLTANLDETEIKLLTGCLSQVIRWESKDDFLHGMSPQRAPSIILNALLAHEIYTQVIRPPFFFMDDQEPGTKQIADIYQQMKISNNQDAQAWRAQTLRLLLPQLGVRTSNEELNIRNNTQREIKGLARKRANQFLHGPASLFIHSDRKAESSKRVKELFVTAANISYELWTRKTSIECSTMAQFTEKPTFDIKNSLITPHPLVNWDEAEDELMGHPIKMIVHPLLRIYGTDKGEKYEEGRVLMPAEVWLPSGVYNTEEEDEDIVIIDE